MQTANESLKNCSLSFLTTILKSIDFSDIEKIEVKIYIKKPLKGDHYA